MSQIIGEDLITGMGFIGLDPGRIYRMRRGPKVTTVTVRGNPAILEHSVNGRFKGLTVYGKSTQITTTGAQLLDKDALINGIIDLSSGVIYSNNAWVVSDFIPVSDLSNYCISQENEVFFQYRIGCYDASKNKITADEKSGNITFCTFSTPEATKYIRIGYSTQLSGSSVDRDNIMLNAGDTALPWEPYTGGKPSPSPEYPQEITSAGTGGNVDVVARGKNIFPTVSESNLTLTNKEDGRGTRYAYVFNMSSAFCVKANAVVQTNLYIANYDPATNTYSNAILIRNVRNTITRTITMEAGMYCIYVAQDALDYALAMNNYKIQVEYGSESTAYEPYHEAQTLTFATTNGLPGIPVDSGGNYTDEAGRQWVCDEIDLERGVYVQRIGSVTLNGSEAWRPDSGGTLLFLLPSVFPVAKDTSVASTVLSDSGILCKSLKYGLIRQGTKNLGLDVYRGAWRVRLYDDWDWTLEDFKDYLAKNPLEVKYILATPVESPLSTAEIAAYKALRAYTGTTVVEASDGAGLSVSYGCDLMAAEKEVNGTYASLMAEMEDLNENSKTL